MFHFTENARSENLEKIFDKLKIDEDSKAKKLESLDIQGIAKYLLTCKNVILMTGAGISTGKFYLLDNIKKCNLR